MFKILTPIALSNPATISRDHEYMNIIMSFGSSFELKMSGGPTNWQDERILIVKNEVIDTSTYYFANNSLIILQ
jgi:hypothetical protein